MSETVRIVEVGPRDGLQNEKTPIGVTDRIAFIKALLGAGLPTVEVGAFVSPKASAISRANSTCWCRTKRVMRPRRRPAPR
jgi:isopropylmalate/homocitrate/citramalate synthase